MLSVLMPVYNVEKYLEKTLESVSAQTYTDFEVIMVDDGSTDSSSSICDLWVEKDPRFRVIHCENGGVSKARNTALAAVKGEYIFFMDSDDTILPETFEELMDALIKNGADIVLGNMYYTDDDGKIIEKLSSGSPVKNETLTAEEYIEKLTTPRANFYCTSTNKIFRKELFDGITYPEGRINEDEARIHEIIFRAKKIVTLEKAYYNYIKHPASITVSPFGVKNLAREQAFYERIEFLRSNGLGKLAEKTALYALDSSLVSFTKSIDAGIYYGDVKTKLRGYIRFFMENCASFASLSSFGKKVYIIAFAILYMPAVYEEYTVFKLKTESMGTPEAVKDEIFEIIMKLFSLLPTRKTIVFESHPEMSCNAYPVYKYLLEKGLGKEYKFVWLTENKSKYGKNGSADADFVEYSKFAKSFADKLKYMYTVSTAKALVYSNQLLGVHGKNRLSLCLQHGMPLKSSNGTYCIKNKCTAAVCVSEFFADNYNKDFRVSKEKMIFTGFPRNDLLLKDNESVEKMGYDGYDKIIFWLPTFRQRNSGSANRLVDTFEMETHGTGIPALETGEDFVRVNEYLKANNCLIILKPHPVQDMSAVSETSLSNFRIINDEDLSKNGVQLYELLGRCDAMITDYSSVYYDYLLTDKPIGLTIGDIDEYTAKRGFVYRDPLEILKGEVITDTSALLGFIENVKNGNDIKKAERTAVKNRIHTVLDASSAEKVGEYIINFLKTGK